MKTFADLAKTSLNRRPPEIDYPSFAVFVSIECETSAERWPGQGYTGSAVEGDARSAGRRRGGLDLDIDLAGWRRGACGRRVEAHAAAAARQPPDFSMQLHLFIQKVLMDQQVRFHMNFKHWRLIFWDF